ncbi:MAG TPA: PHP domain-containing protein [Spirochaetota bacterium]|nr:PHP domain-containing protein [Spirochaetota bacterium]HOM11264.1 PHP domain-containing protein [Spirochaetota bacterium]HPP50996.1 PHP domain-containing protein [Spirochaetota bacterium]
MELIDLHCHTTASDGIYSPTGIIDYAIVHNVSVLAITDHDSIDGLEEALDYAKQKLFELIPGIEFSIDFPHGSFHLVGMGIDYTNGDLRYELEHLQMLRKERIYKIIKDLQLHGIEVTDEEVEKEALGNSPGRPHVARVLVKKGYAPTVSDVFTQFMVKGKPGFVKKEKINFHRALQLIKASGGTAIVAHPVSLGFSTWDECEQLIKDFVDAGVAGIEVYSAMHSDEDVTHLLHIAQKYSLLISGGSDFHGDKNEAMGYYGEGKPIPAGLAKQFLKTVK